MGEGAWAGDVHEEILPVVAGQASLEKGFRGQLSMTWVYRAGQELKANDGAPTVIVQANEFGRPPAHKTARHFGLGVGKKAKNREVV
jgi:hypothetical protein